MVAAWLTAFGVLKGWDVMGGNWEAYWSGGSYMDKCQVFEVTWIAAIVAGGLWCGSFVLGLVIWLRGRKGGRR